MGMDAIAIVIGEVGPTTGTTRGSHGERLLGAIDTAMDAIAIAIGRAVVMAARPYTMMDRFRIHRRFSLGSASISKSIA